MSLDGFVAGPNQSADDPIGVGGMRLHEWVFPLSAWRAMQGMDAGEEGPSNDVIREFEGNLGATIMGRNMFGPVRGAWDAAQPWNGWWGDTPLYHHPVFVLTRHARAPITMQGGTAFHFVTDGIGVALEQARAAARGRDVSLAGGESTARQYLAAGLVDDMEISLVPILLGAGERLFDGLGD